MKLPLLAAIALLCGARLAHAAEPVDVALVLKALPPLEQAERSAGLGLLRALQARYIFVSFPTRTLGGRNVQMAANYEARFRALLESEGWSADRFAFPGELCFRIARS